VVSTDDPAGAQSLPQRLLLGLLPAWHWLARRRLTAVFLAVLWLIGALLVVAAPHRAHRYAEDTFLFLDGGWRVLEGQRPYVDFYSSLGPVTYLLVALGFRLSGTGPAGIDYGFTAACLLLGIWAWLVFRSRSEAPTACLLALFVVLIGISPHALGSRPDMLTYASIYNRFGYALVILVLVEALRAPAADSARRTRADRLGGLSSGAACALAFFLKPSFFLVAAALTLVSYLFRDRRAVARTQGLAVGGAAVALPMLLYLRFDVAAVLSNLRTVATARAQVGARSTSALGSSVFGGDAVLAVRENGLGFCGLVLLGLLVTILPRAQRLPRWFDPWWPLAAACGVCLVDIAFVMTNGVQFAAPLTAAFALLLGSEVYDWWRGATADRHLRYDFVCATGMVLGLALFFPQMVLDFTSVAYSAAVSARGPAPEARFHAPRLRAFLTRDAPPHWTEPKNGRAIVDRVNDGTALLTASSAPEETVFTLDFGNPFSYALGRRPPVGGSPYLGGSIFNASHMPRLDRMAGTADLVMMPRHPIDAALDTWLRQVFDGYIQAHYHLAAESYYWSLYRKINPALLPDPRR